MFMNFLAPLQSDEDSDEENDYNVGQLHNEYSSDDEFSGETSN